MQAAPRTLAPRNPAAVDVPGVVQVRGGRARRIAERIAAEVAVALAYNGAAHAVMLASPADLEDFAVGFSLSEGIVGSLAEIAGVAVAERARGIEVEVLIPEARAAGLAGRQRHLAGRGGCGLCGVGSLAEALRPLPELPATPAFPASAVARAIAALPGMQTVNRETGALHAAAFADRTGALVAVREDVGRHNALDKLAGAVLRAGHDPAGGFVLMTSRLGVELVQKAAMCGFPLLAAISAPTSLAIEFARTCNLTLAAFARPGGFNLYSRPERVAVGQ